MYVCKSASLKICPCVWGRRREMKQLDSSKKCRMCAFVVDIHPLLFCIAILVYLFSYLRDRLLPSLQFLGIILIELGRLYISLKRWPFHGRASPLTRQSQPPLCELMLARNVYCADEKERFHQYQTCLFFYHFITYVPSPTNLLLVFRAALVND